MFESWNTSRGGNMKECQDCGKEFEEPFNEELCPYCLSGDVIDE